MLQHAVLLCLCLYLFRRLEASFPFAAMVMAAFWWSRRTQDRSWLLLVLVCLCLLRLDQPSEVRLPFTGRVCQVRASYIVVQQGQDRVLAYTEEEIPLDALVTVSGEETWIRNSPGFYHFDTEAWLFGLQIDGIVQQAQIQVLQEYPTPRALVQKRIRKCTDSGLQKLLRQFLLNIRSREEEELADFGFSLSAQLALIDWLLKRHLEKQKRQYVMFWLGLLLNLYAGFPLIGQIWLLFHQPSRNLKISARQKAGLVFSAVLLLNPGAGSSGILPILLFLRLSERQERWQRLFLLSFLQSLQNQEVQPLRLLCFPVYRLLLGFYSLLAWVQLLFLSHPFVLLWDLLARTAASASRFTVPGSVIGAGLPFFLLLCRQIRGRQKDLFRCALLYGFLLSGLFHPFAEVSFLNVGQGDCILLRGPLNSVSILVDTGKPSQLNRVETYLNAKGIRKLDVLLISHADADHAGNQKEICAAWQPDTVITGHYDTLEAGIFRLQDLNPLQNAEENQSSVTACFSLNGLRYFLTGDMDQTAEAAVLDRYGTFPIDILKCAHHGSSTGSSGDFLDAVQPHLAVISCGSYALYHHPSAETIQRLEERRIPYLLTRQEGDICFLALPGGTLLITSSGTFAWIRASGAAHAIMKS